MKKTIEMDLTNSLQVLTGECDSISERINALRNEIAAVSKKVRNGDRDP
jgi:hypothetical protein